MNKINITKTLKNLFINKQDETFIIDSISEKSYTYSGFLNLVLSIFEYLKENKIEGNGFHSDAQGDMVIWYNFPKTKVFVDSRDGVYSGEHQNKYAKIIYIIKEVYICIQKMIF